MTDFVTLADLTAPALTGLVDASAAWKRARPHGPAPWLAGKRCSTPD